MNILWRFSRTCLPRSSSFSLHQISSFSSLSTPTTRIAIARASPQTCHSIWPQPRPRPGSLGTSRRELMTIAIETSCDDTCIAIIEKTNNNAARLHFNERLSLDIHEFRGVNPLGAVESHGRRLAKLLHKALRALPEAPPPPPPPPPIKNNNNNKSHDYEKLVWIDGTPRRKPDFVSVTRGPGMPACLAVGINTAKALAVSWDVPLLAVNHMQGHALTPRLARALVDEDGKRIFPADTMTTRSTSTSTSSSDRDQALKEGEGGREDVQFPFYSLLVSGGHSMLLSSQSLNDHRILANADDVVVGNMLDKCARAILPSSVVDASSGDGRNMYGPLLEEFAFPGSRTTADGSYDYDYTPPRRRADEIKIYDSGQGWFLTPPLALSGRGEAAAARYNFAGLNGAVQKVMLENKDMDVDMRRTLARTTMRLAFEHLASRLVIALKKANNKPQPQPRSGDDDESSAASTDAEGEGDGVQENSPPIKTVVLSGGVASNKFLRHVVRGMLDARGFADVELVAPPVALCCDNAAMIAWAAMDMYEAGWRSDLGVLALQTWSLDPSAEDGGILGPDGWYNVSTTKG